MTALRSTAMGVSLRNLHMGNAPDLCRERYGYAERRRRALKMELPVTRAVNYGFLRRWSTLPAVWGIEEPQATGKTPCRAGVLYAVTSRPDQAGASNLPFDARCGPSHRSLALAPGHLTAGGPRPAQLSNSVRRSVGVTATAVTRRDVS